MEISLIFNKIRTLCKEFNITPLPQKINSDYNAEILSSYLHGLDQLRIHIFNLRGIENEYKKLEEALQKNETQIRKHVGVEQQLKLYIDTLKVQYDESEAERTSLLESSKKMIKELKKENEKLYLYLREKRQSHSKNKVKDHSVKHKTENVEDISEYCSNTKKKIDFSAPFKVELSDRKRKEEKSLLQCKKKQQYRSMIMSYLPSTKKKFSKEKPKTPKKKNKRGTEKSEDKHQKKANRSVFSVSSVEERRLFCCSSK